MDTIIYRAPPQEKIILTDSDFIFDTEPSKQLLKLGFSQIINSLPISDMINNPHYTTYLRFDFDRTDKNSMKELCAKIFGKMSSADLKLFCIYWECIVLFGLFNKLPPKSKIFSSDTSIVEKIIKAYKSIFELDSDLFIAKESEIANLILFTWSSIDIDENAYVHLLLNNLSLLSKQIVGSSLVLQIFGIQTQVMAELFYYLTSLYNEAYIVKPQVSSDLSDEKYLVLINMKEPIKNIRIKIPPKKHCKHILSVAIPDPIVRCIQCINSELYPNKFVTYHTIKEFLDKKNFEGLLYEEQLQRQDIYTNNWIKSFTEKENKMADRSLARTDELCKDNYL